MRGIVSLLVLAGCGASGASHDVLVLASTTSTYDSGLFDALVPAFEAAHDGVRVRLVAVGSGQALELGRRGDADVLLVHGSADDEEAFMRAGHGSSRLPVMYNDFVFVGPPADPAQLRTAADAADALRRAAAPGSTFVSRGDGSGTHVRELWLWAQAQDAPPAPPRRLEVGQGMGETLVLAAERGAYTLTDRATWVALASTLPLAVAFEGDSALVNQYSVIVVRRARNGDAARRFAEWITSTEGARVIEGFGGRNADRPLFVPGTPAH